MQQQQSKWTKKRLIAEILNKKEGLKINGIHFLQQGTPQIFV